MAARGDEVDELRGEHGCRGRGEAPRRRRRGLRRRGRHRPRRAGHEHLVARRRHARTPSLELGILAGETRATLIGLAAGLGYTVEEGAFPLDAPARSGRGIHLVVRPRGAAGRRRRRRRARSRAGCRRPPGRAAPAGRARLRAASAERLRSRPRRGAHTRRGRRPRRSGPRTASRRRPRCSAPPRHRARRLARDAARTAPRPRPAPRRRRAACGAGRRRPRSRSRRPGRRGASPAARRRPSRTTRIALPRRAPGARRPLAPAARCRTPGRPRTHPWRRSARRGSAARASTCRPRRVRRSPRARARATRCARPPRARAPPWRPRDVTLPSERWTKIRLGGMALQNGVLVHGPTSWAAAVRDGSGAIHVASGVKRRFAPGRHDTDPARPTAARRGVRRAPGCQAPPPAGPLPVRASGSRGGRRRGLCTGRRRTAGAHVRALRGRRSPRSPRSRPAALALRGGELASYHGAEHVSIGSYERDGEVAPREHDRCGSHLIGPLLASSAVAGVLAVPGAAAHPRHRAARRRGRRSGRVRGGVRLDGPAPG